MKCILHLAFAIFIGVNGLGAESNSPTARALRIQVPRVDLRDATLREACEFLSQKSRQLDSKRINIIIAAEAPGRITLNLNNSPLLEALREAVALVGCEVQEEPYALVIRKIGAPKFPAVLVKDANLEAIRKKLDQIVLPVVDFQECNPREAIEFLAQKSKQVDPANGGLSIILKMDDQGGGRVPIAPAPAPEVPGIPGLKAGPAANAAPTLARAEGSRITLRCDEVPVLEVIRYTAGLAGLEVELQQFAVFIRPPNPEPKPR